MNKFKNRANSRVSFGSAATLLFVVTLAGQMLGFLRNRLVSANWNDPSQIGSTDAFFAAFQIPDFFFYTIAAGALGVAFMPVLAERLEAGDKKHLWAITSSILNLLTIAMLVVAVILFVFAQPLISALYPKLPEQNLNEAVLMLRLISLNPLFFTLAGIITSVQQTFGRFFFYAIGPLIYNASVIASIYIFKDSMGIVGLAVGAVIGGVLQLLVSWMGMAGLKFKYTPKIFFKNKDFRHVLRQLPPRSLDQGIDQVNSVVELNRANNLGIGSISNYSYAVTLMNVPIMLLGSSIATAAFPRLNERLAQGRPDLFRKDFLSILRTMIWLLMPVCVVAYFARGYLARLIFGNLAPQVALIFGFLVVAVFFRSIYAMVSRYFYAQKDTVTPLLGSIAAIALNIYLAFTLARSDSYGVSGLALAQSIVATAEVALLFVVMVVRDPKLIDKYFWGGIFKIVAVTGFSLVAAFMMISLLPLTTVDRGFVTLGVKLGTISLVTLMVHIVVSWIFGLEEVKPIVDKAKKIVLGTVKIQ
ncbi:MAG: putative peptidoglycan lipid flippase [Patescibacteria group bacterium]|nr:putative peptidoglycan lipid flippase [Patescibacteria group bacterium]